MLTMRIDEQFATQYSEYMVLYIVRNHYVRRAISGRQEQRANGLV